MTTLAQPKETALKSQLTAQGYTTKLFSQSLREELLTHIEGHIRQVASSYAKPDEAATLSLERIAALVPDDVWAKQMTRAFRIFPKLLANKIHQWADDSLCKELGRSRSCVNVVYVQEVETNPQLSLDNLAIYWRCVRPGKPDAGRPHTDASFWDLEFKEGYDPKISFSFNYLSDCVKIWIPLKGCIPTTTLQIIPCSHKMNIPTSIEQTEYGRRPSISGEWLQKYEKDFMSPVELSQGSCIIFDMNLVHRGPVHNNTELRISAELNFILS